MALIVEQFTCRTDNFGLLIHDPKAGVTASIDAPEFGPIKARLDEKGWRLNKILTTHHHGDHVEANLALKKAYACTVTGPAEEADRIPGIDDEVRGGDAFMFGAFEVRVIDTPGHTAGHVSYWLPGPAIVFTADTLFALGCGRIFEGTPQVMWASLEKLAALPEDTQIYCGHEYTEANARFAVTVEPDNAELIARAEKVRRQRAVGEATLPTTIGLEKRTNPFLRAREPSIRAKLGMEKAPAAEVFGELRKRKDSFR
jgi:hydroxyacylglutathione hydrolase